jgi:3-deoxy-manno-octulosonate cytidylyltransferase (CMP-KDO synthetase)
MRLPRRGGGGGTECHQRAGGAGQIPVCLPSGNPYKQRACATFVHVGVHVGRGPGRAKPMPDAIILIPARMASTRLPGKPLIDIAGQAMIVHVVRRAAAAGIGDVVVAADSEAVVAAVEKSGGRALMTRSDHASGSDRIFEALQALDPERRFDIVVNVQGDLPTIEPADIAVALSPLSDGAVDIATLAAEIKAPEERTNPNVVKVSGSPISPGRLRALRFSRAGAHGPGPHYHHIGLYAYRRAALERFVKLPPSVNEQREKLEQLRALDAGMRIDVAIVKSVPLGVDTAADLVKARAMLAG